MSGIIDPCQARDDLPNQDHPMTKAEYYELMRRKGFHFTDDNHFHDKTGRYAFREIDHLDGCVYDCPIHPGVWSDWCNSRNCRLRCLGNAVVPQQVYPILAGIAQIELSEGM